MTHAGIAGLSQLIDMLAATSRRVVETPHEYPKAPDLLAELERDANLLDVAAKLTELGYPAESALFCTRARLVRAKIAIARNA